MMTCCPLSTATSFSPVGEGEGPSPQETTSLNQIYPISPVQQVYGGGNAGDATAQNHYFWDCIQ